MLFSRSHDAGRERRAVQPRELRLADQGDCTHHISGVLDAMRWPADGGAT
jgi:hypothetical protein